jgi:hypothetical protein
MTDSKDNDSSLQAAAEAMRIRVEDDRNNNSLSFFTVADQLSALQTLATTADKLQLQAPYNTLPSEHFLSLLPRFVGLIFPVLSDTTDTAMIDTVYCPLYVAVSEDLSEIADTVAQSMFLRLHTVGVVNIRLYREFYKDTLTNTVTAVHPDQQEEIDQENLMRQAYIQFKQICDQDALMYAGIWYNLFSAADPADVMDVYAGAVKLKAQELVEEVEAMDLELQTYVTSRFLHDDPTYLK